MLETGLRERQRAAGRTLVGTFALLPHPETLELVALAGYDFVVVDLEHGAISVRDLPVLVAVGNARGLHVVVRVPSAEPWVGQVLDVGADGVVVPQVGDADGAAAVVAAARYAPDGHRGLSGFVRAADWSATDHSTLVERSNRLATVMGMVEGSGALAAFDDITAVRGLDAVFIGPMDLSLSLGHGGDPEHPAVVEAVTGLRARAAARGLLTSVWAPTVDAAIRWSRLGVELVALNTDTGQMLAGLRDPLQAVRNAAVEPLAG